MLLQPVHTSPRRPLRRTIVFLIAAAAVVSGALGYQSATSAHDSVTAPVIRPITRSTGIRLGAPPAPNGEALHRVGDNAGPDAADGVLPGPTSVFSNEYVGITKLDPAMLAALRRAATDAQRDGLTMYVDSGWRSKIYQGQLFDQAVLQYGSEAAAARWVARPGTSVHEAGDAVDIGHSDAAAWLSRNGAAYGLCRMYGNEPWHFEWRPAAVSNGCPTMYANPTDDPRLGK